MRIASIETRSYRYPLDPPFLAAWAPNILFSGSGLYLLLKTGT